MSGNSSIIAKRRPEDLAVEILVRDRRKFLNFVRASVHDLDDAEEIVQKASAKILSKAASLRDKTRAEAWIYRLLRNEIVDHFRKRAIQSKRNQELTDEVLFNTLSPASAVDSRPCPCAAQELTTLRENYADALRAVEMNDESTGAYARRKGMSANNAMVLLHRARKSLRSRLEARCGSCAGAGCFDCSCSA